MRHAWGRPVGQGEKETLCSVTMEARVKDLDTHCGKEACFREIRVKQESGNAWEVGLQMMDSAKEGLAQGSNSGSSPLRLL